MTQTHGFIRCLIIGQNFHLSTQRKGKGGEDMCSVGILQKHVLQIPSLTSINFEACIPVIRSLIEQDFLVQHRCNNSAGWLVRGSSCPGRVLQYGS